MLHSSVEGSAAEGASKAADAVKSGILEAGTVQEKDGHTAPGWYGAKMRLQLSDIRFGFAKPIMLIHLACGPSLGVSC